jgi:outer membrane receptor protein involved in Fe transport
VDDRGLLEIRFEPQLLPQLQLLTRAYGNFTHYASSLRFEQFPVESDPSIRFEQSYHETYYGAWGGAEARFVWQPVSQLRATLGGEGVVHPLVQVDGDQTEYMQPNRTRTLRERRPYGTYSAYALVDWTPLELVSISLGTRFDYWDNTQSATTTGAAPDFINISPRLAVILHPSASDTLKLMGARAFRAPSVYENYYADSGATQLESTCCGTTLSPEVVYQAELEYTHRFDPEWTVLGSVHGQYDESQIDSAQVPVDVLNSRGLPPDAVLTYYRNTTSPVLVYGADLVVRREFRNGWMFDVQLGAQDARFLNTTGNNRVPNAPPLTGSVRGVVPIIGRALQAAIRVSAEGQRRIDMTSDAETSWAAIADVVVSGNVNEFGLRYAVGVYNLFDYRLALPAAPYASRTIPQEGRTFMLSLTLTL